MGGARVVPIPYNMPYEELQSIMGSINGLLYTGGGNYLINDNKTRTDLGQRICDMFDIAK
jgi:hypothetical protein